MTMLISDKIDFKTIKVIKEKRTLYINKSVNTAKRTSINIGTTNNRPGKFMKEGVCRWLSWLSV